MTALAALAAAVDRLAGVTDSAIVISEVPAARRDALAAAIDAAPASDVPLRGTTFAVKDNIAVEGTVTTAACPSFSAAFAGSAGVVERLIGAGAVPLMKTNLDQFATGLVGTRSPHGTPTNPFDPALVPGGSSSGSAVAVATGVVPFALGTDTAGSGRVPAAMCGIVGLKPTRGWWSTRGVVPAVRSIDCVSVFAATLELTWRVAQVAGAFDEDDPHSRPAPPMSRAVARTAGVLPESILRAIGVDDAEIAGYLHACDTLVAAGIPTTDFDPTFMFDIGDLLYDGPWVAERFSAVGDHILGGHEGLDPVVASIIGRGANWTAVETFDAQHRLSELRRGIDALFDEVDVVMLPTLPGLATIAQVVADPRGVNTRLGRFTTFTNLADLCALSFPVGPTVAGASRPPVSVTLQGPAWSDAMLVHTAGIVRPDMAVPVDLPRGWIALAVAGAHLRGQPLEWQLTDRRAVFLRTTSTAPDYRLYSLADTTPPKPGLVRAVDGVAIEVDVWALSPAAFGDFVAHVPPPLAIGTVRLADGSSIPGFTCEPAALDGALDISAYGGWRSFRQQ